MTIGLILGGYALEPARDALGDREAEWYELLGGIEGGAGLELPLRAGRLHPDGAARLAELLPRGWRVVVTMLPATMAGMRAAAGYGLASPDDEGRAAALADLGLLRDELRRLNDATGESTALAVHVHSGPRGTATAQAFTRSLDELTAQDWSGAVLSVEHCDAWRPDGVVEKGFLSLDDELAAVRAAGVGQSINWGRSVIEARSADGGSQQIAEVAAAGTLTGVFFSGASASWKDVHDPIDTVEPASLLTRAEIDRAVAAWAGTPPQFVGVKVGDPEGAADWSRHLEPLRATAAAVREALA